MFFRDKYRPIPPIYNLVLAMLWRHPENVELDKLKVVHYCAAVSIKDALKTITTASSFYIYNKSVVLMAFVCLN